MGEWIDPEERECSTVLLGDPADGTVSLGIAVFGDPAEVRRLLAFPDEDGYVVMAAPADSCGAVVKSVGVGVLAAAVVDVEPLEDLGECDEVEFG